MTRSNAKKSWSLVKSSLRPTPRLSTWKTIPPENVISVVTFTAFYQNIPALSIWWLSPSIWRLNFPLRLLAGRDAEAIFSAVSAHYGLDRSALASEGPEDQPLAAFEFHGRFPV